MERAWIFCAIFLVGFACVASAEVPLGVAGGWKGTSEGRAGYRMDLEMTLKQDGEKVTGTFFNPSNKHLTNVGVTGTVHGNGLSLQIEGGGALEGTVSGDTMTGKWMAPQTSGGNWIPFSVTRTK